jgi:hypothetical protein
VNFYREKKKERERETETEREIERESCERKTVLRYFTQVDILCFE